MPEGPSIVILREQAQKFAGQVVREVSGNSRQDIQRMHGRKVRAVCSWGKHFLLDFDGFVLRIHFMLFGRSRVDDPKEGGTPRLTLKFDNGRLDLYACSVQFLEGQVDELYDWSVDVMADAWDPARARKRLRDSPHVLAADALLDQEWFAGVGNIIKNEVLWRIRVHPESEVGALPAKKLGELVKQAREYSFDFLEWKKAFVLKKHYQVHTKTHCPRDGTRLSYRKELGRARRRAFFCEKVPEAVSVEPTRGRLVAASAAPPCADGGVATFAARPSRRIRYRPLPTMIAAPTQVTPSGSTRQIARSSSTPQASAVYSSGASNEASPSRNASVIRYWPSAPAKPSASTSQACSIRSGTHCGHAIRPAPSAISAISQTTIAWLLSVRARIRTVIAETA